MNEKDLLRKTAQEFARRETGSDFSGMVLRARSAGLFEIDSLNNLCRVLEEVAEHDAGLGALILSQFISRHFDHTANGSLVGIALFQDHSKDSASVQALRKGSDYCLTGDVQSLLPGKGAEYWIVPAKIQGQSEISYFVVKSGDADLIPVQGMGLRGCPIADLKLNATKAQLCPTKSDPKFLREAHIATAALLIGVLRPALGSAVDYAKERTQGARKIIDWSAHRMLLADLLAQIRVSEAACSEALRACQEEHGDAEVLALSVAIRLQEMAGSFSSNALRSLGGSGYMKDFPLERYFRDAHMLSSLFGRPSLKKLRLFEISVGANQ